MFHLSRIKFKYQGSRRRMVAWVQKVNNFIYTYIHFLVYHVAADMRMKQALRPGILSAGQPWTFPQLTYPVTRG